MQTRHAMLAALFLAASASMAAAQSACSTHVVVQGDTLARISEAAFGTGDRAFEIYELNRAIIGADPNIIEEGQVLTLPCDDAEADGGEAVGAQAVVAAGNRAVEDAETLEDLPSLGTPGDAPAEAEAEEEAVAAIPDTAPMAVEDTATRPRMTPRDGRFHILTGGPLIPLVGRDLENGGLFTELVDRALTLTGEREAFDIHFVNDRDAHLSILMPLGGFDMVFPWTYPDCRQPDLAPETVRFCNAYVASDPIYEVELGFFARGESRMADVRRASDLNGALICRPAGLGVDDLDRLGLLDRINLTVTETPAECLRLLDLGLVDIASMDSAVARSLVRMMEIENQLIVLDGLASTVTLHVIAPRTNTRAVAELDRINAGIRELSEAGSWAEIVRRQLDSQPIQ